MAGKKRGRGAGESKTSPRIVQAVERAGKALVLRKAGATYEQIGKELGISYQAAFMAVRHALQRTIQEPADEYRAIEWERLQTLLRAVWPAALKGGLGAIDRALKIGERMAQLMGYDVVRPQRVEHSGPEGTPISAVVLNAVVDVAELSKPERLQQVMELALKFNLMDRMFPGVRPPLNGGGNGGAHA